MRVSAQVSLYPLRQQELSPAIDAVSEAFESEGIESKIGPMSTMATGEARRLFAGLQEAFERAASEGPVVMVVTVSNACPTGDPIRHGMEDL